MRPSLLRARSLAIASASSQSLGGHAEPTAAESGSAFAIRSGNDEGVGVGHQKLKEGAALLGSGRDAR